MFHIQPIPRFQMLEMVQKYHYSNTLPAINKVFLWCFDNGVLVWAISLWYWTRPKHTIELLFDNVGVNEYLEIGRMCMVEEMPRNSESQMISCLIKRLKKNYPIKVLFTWADWMMGKPWYVYQACSFEYCWYALTDTYMFRWTKLHPRQMHNVIPNINKQIGIRPTREQMQSLWIKQFFWKQFKYVKVLSKNIKRKYKPLPYPKHIDLERFENTASWKIKVEAPIFNSDTTARKLQNIDTLF